MKDTTRRTHRLLQTLLPALLLGLACLAPRATASTAPATTFFKVVNTSSGLPDNSINDIAEDKFGFLWIGTWNGLSRYDGMNIENFVHSDDKPSIAGSMVRCVAPTDSGVWAGTDAGLDFMRYSDSRFIHSKSTEVRNGELHSIKGRISRLLPTDKGLIAVNIDGEMLSYLSQGGAEEPYNLFEKLPKPVSRRYADIATYTNGRLIALSNEGITILSADGKREISHHNRPCNYDSNMNMLCDTLTNTIYVGGGIGTESEAYRVDPATLNISEVEDAPVFKGLMKAVRNDNKLYFATDGHGLYALDDDGTLTNYTPKNSHIPGDAIYTVFTDSHDNIWCGTYRQGLCLLSRELNTYTVLNTASGSLTYDIVTAIVPTESTYYVGLDGGGIDIIDGKTGTIRNYNSRNSALPGDNVVSLLSDGTTLWAAIYSGGLSSIDERTGAINTYKVETGYEPGNKLWVLANDNRGSIWVGGRALHIFNKATGKFTLVPGCDNISVMSIIDDGNYMWVGTRFQGILQIDKDKRRVINRHSDSPTPGGVLLPSHRIDFLSIDPFGMLWADLGEKGLYSIDTANNNDMQCHNLGGNLSQEHVRSMLCDDENNIWFGTDGGLYKYLRRSGTIIRKNDSRLPLAYTANACARMGDTVFFGTTGGLLTFSLSESLRESDSPATLFTSIEIFDSQRTKIPLYSTGNKVVELDNQQNFFKVYFSIPEMSNPTQIALECRLEGLEDVWREASEPRSATYTNVPAGNYRLLVRHTGPDGNWSEPVALGIKVKPAWYATMWSRSAGILLALILISFGLYIWRQSILNQEKAHMAELERDSQKRLNEAKMDFYANVTHELRTPCFLISAQIEEILDSERQTIPVSTLHGIYRNSAKLNKLINHIIDFRKNDSGHLALASRETELTRFLQELTFDYEQLCRQKGINFTYTHDDPPIIACIDPDKLEQIVTNLVSNAYKYTHNGGTVTLAVKDLNDQVAISVSDTGIGIVDKLHTAIFEPFVRTERGRSQSAGDGIGLAYVKELVELHGGTITLESRVNEGSTFTIRLPKQQSENKEVAKAPVRETKALPSPAAPAPGTMVSNPTATRTLLLVDDDPEVTALVAGAFVDDYRVSRASSGTEGLAMLKADDYDVVITDIMMPEFDGHSLLQAIKSDPKLKNIKVVVFSAAVGEDDMVKAFDEGADAYLTKPTPLKVIRRQVERLFERPDDDNVFASRLTTGTYNREEQKFLRRCREIIDANLYDENFGIELLASKLAMSHSSLYKKIRKMTGLSLIEFINEYRICKAVSLFHKGNTNVQKVAEMCGFRDIKTFRETFKRRMNMPPKQYILQLTRTSGKDQRANDIQLTDPIDAADVTSASEDEPKRREEKTRRRKSSKHPGKGNSAEDINDTDDSAENAVEEDVNVEEPIADAINSEAEEKSPEADDTAANDEQEKALS